MTAEISTSTDQHLKTLPSSEQTADQRHLSQQFNAHPRQARNQSSLSEQQEETIILQKYGVARSVHDGQIQYTLPGSSQNQLLFEAKPGAAEFAESQQKLTAMTEAKSDEIQTKFHVTFGKDNETAVRPYVYSKAHPHREVPGPAIQGRVPRLSELMGIDAALEASGPSQLVKSDNDAGLKFYFLKTATYGKNTSDAACFATDVKEKFSVFFEPDAQPDRPITVADAIETHQNIKTSIEALALHEVAHNAEWNMGLYDPEKMKPIAENLGWTTSTDSQYWLLKGQQGDFYRLTNSGMREGENWIQCDAQGHPLDRSGKVVAESTAPHYTNADTREKALVRPATDYFVSPDEMLADSLMLYRAGEVGRRELFKSGGHQLYNTVKDFDQSEMDARFGKNDDGTAKKIRLPDGHLVDNTEQSVQIAETFDRSLI